MQNQIQDYLITLLKQCSQYELTNLDYEQIQKSGIEHFIYAKLTSKKFRKYKMTEKAIAHTKTAIQKRLEKKDPIHVIYPQGGYKIWRFPSSPNADWAEFFAIAYVLSYIAPLAKAYEPGVVITFYHHTLLMEKHDNLTKDEIQAYGNSFEALLNEFRQYLPANITVQIKRDTDLYTREEYFTELEEQRQLEEKDYPSWSEEKKQEFKRMAQLNIKWQGKEDWTALPDEEKEKKIYLAALYEKAVSQLTRVNQTIKSEENILVFTKAAGTFIGIGSTKASIAKYWVGYGVLVVRNDRLQPVVLTPEQFIKAKDTSWKEYPVSIIQGNLANIMVFDKPFAFT